MRFSRPAFFALAAGVLLSAAPVMAQTPTSIYELNGTLTDSLGNSPELVNNGATQDPNGLLFGANQGPSLSGSPTLAGQTYSIELYFEFDDVTDYNKIIDFKNRSSDGGLYVRNSTLNFYQITGDGPVGAFAPNTPAHVILTRDSGTTLVTGYVNGVQQIQFADSGGDALFTGTNNIAYFFVDDSAVGGEASAGSVDYIRLYNTALTAEEARNRFSNRGTFFQPAAAADAPEPSALCLALPMLGLVTGRVVRRRTIAKS